MENLVVREYLGSIIEFKIENGIVYANANKMASAFENGVQKLKDWKRSAKTKEYIAVLSEVENFHFGINTKTGGLNGGETWIHEKLVINLARYLDIKFEIWCDNQIESLIRNGKVEITAPKQESITEKNFIALAHISNIMGYNDSSKALQVNKLIGSLGLDSCLLIDYTKSNGNLLSATELLKRNNRNISANAFNKLMISNDFMEQRTRPSTGGKTKQYKSLTDKGLEFGENQVSPTNPRETQPLYFDVKFAELCEQLGI